MTESLRLRGEEKYIPTSWADMVRPGVVDTRTGDEIAADVIRSAGLKIPGMRGEDDGAGI